MRSLLQRVVASVGRSEPRGVCYREWSGVHYRGLPESGGATWNPLQRVEWGNGHYRDLLESSDLTAEARLESLMEWNGSLSQQSERSSDVFEVANGLTVVGHRWCCKWKSSVVEARTRTACWTSLIA